MIQEANIGVSDGLIAKILKLLKKSESCKKIDSLQEAEAFAQKAMLLMMENNLSMETIDSHAEADAKKDKVTESGYADGIKYGNIKSDGDFEIKLANTIAYFNMCRIIFDRYRNGISVIGRIDNIKGCIFIYEVVMDAIRAASRTEYIAMVDAVKSRYMVAASDKEHALERIMELFYAANNYMDMPDGKNPNMIRSDYRHMKKMPTIADIVEVKDDKGCFTFGRPEMQGFVPYREVFIRNFLKGAVSGVQTKLSRMRQSSEVAQTYGIVLANRDRENTEYVNAIPNLKTEKLKTKIHDYEAFSKGHRFGENVSIAKGIGTESVKHKELS